MQTYTTQLVTEINTKNNVVLYNCDLRSQYLICGYFSEKPMQMAGLLSLLDCGKVKMQIVLRMVATC